MTGYKLGEAIVGLTFRTSGYDRSINMAVKKLNSLARALDRVSSAGQGIRLPDFGAQQIIDGMRADTQRIMDLVSGTIQQVAQAQGGLPETPSGSL